MSWAWWELCAKGAIRKSVYTGKNQGGTCRLDLEGPWSRWLEYSRVKRMGRSVRMWDSTPGDDTNLLGGWLWKPGKQYGPTEWSWKAECLRQVVEEGTKKLSKAAHAGEDGRLCSKSGPRGLGTHEVAVNMPVKKAPASSTLLCRLARSLFTESSGMSESQSNRSQLLALTASIQGQLCSEWDPGGTQGALPHWESKRLLIGWNRAHFS